MRGFLVGHCGRSERDCLYVSFREFLDLRDWHEREERRRAEEIRWQKFLDARMNPTLKRRPNRPEELYSFPWEQAGQGDLKPEDCRITSEEAQALNEIFGRNKKQEQ